MKRQFFRNSVIHLVFAALAVMAAVNVQAQEASQQAAQPDSQLSGLWIDVRTVEEFNSGHLEGAINIPHGDIGHKISAVAGDLGQPIHLYCKSGTRAGLALEILMEMGYQDVTNEGGYEAILAKQQNQ